MNSFVTLLLGEVQRMTKYKILAASFVVAVIWIGVLWTTDFGNISTVFPLMMFLDVTSMSMLLVGVTMFFEKQENTIKTMLVSPIGKGEYLVAKVCGNILSNILTLVLLLAYGMLFKDLQVNIPGLFGAVILVSLVHSLIGIFITYYSKDFTSLLMWVMAYSFIFIIPVTLEQVGLIENEMVKRLFFVLPTKSGMTLLNATVVRPETIELVISLSYLLVVAGVGYYLVRRKFDAYAVKESGV